MAAFNIRLNPNGLPQPGKHSTEVPMSRGDKQMTFTQPANPTSTLWTRELSNCCVIAAYHPGNAQREMIHIQGGLPKPEVYTSLAANHDATSTFIIVGGSAWSQIAVDDHSTRIQKELANQGMHVNPGQFLTFCTQGVYDEMVSTTFVFKDDGEYGMIDTALPAVNDPHPGGGNGQGCCTLV
jgi:hypothetical protein